MAFDDTTLFNDGLTASFVMKASTTIEQNQLVMLAVATGLVEPAADDTTGMKFVGVALETVTSAASGTYKVRCAIGSPTVCMTVTGSGGSGVLVQADIGKPAAVVNATQFTVAGTNNDAVAGVLVGVLEGSTTKGYVRLDGLNSKTTASTSD